MTESNPLINMHQAILDLFRSACEAVLQECLDKNDYQFAENTIKLTLEYLKAKRLP